MEMIRVWLVIVVGALVAVVVLAVPAGASSSISANASVVTSTVRNAFYVQPSSPPVAKISCPSKQVHAFSTYQCTAYIGGQGVPVGIKVLDTVPLTVEATPLRAVLSVDRSEGNLEGRYFERTGQAVSAVCPGGTKLYFVVDPGYTLTCKLIGPQGQVGTGTVTVTDRVGGYASAVLPE
jgi:hypothetical protein